MVGKISGWSVLDDITDSDNTVIAFGLTLLPHDKSQPRVTLKFDTKRTDWFAFNNVLMQKIEHDSAKNIDEQGKSIISALQTAVKASIPMRNSRRWALGRQPWWTNELTQLKNSLNRLRRAGAHRDDRSTYKSSRNNYLHEIRKAKMAVWRTFSGDINTKQWDKAFRYAKNGKMGARRGVSKKRPVFC